MPNNLRWPIDHKVNKNGNIEECDNESKLLGAFINKID